jgi:hypothetical protein
MCNAALSAGPQSSDNGFPMTPIHFDTDSVALRWLVSPRFLKTFEHSSSGPLQSLATQEVQLLQLRVEDLASTVDDLSSRLDDLETGTGDNASSSVDDLSSSVDSLCATVIDAGC